MIDRAEALASIEYGHHVYPQAYADEICDALGAPHVKGRAMHSDPPGTFKGLTMAESTEGSVCVGALELGSAICHHLGIQVRECFGRGSQGRAYAAALASHFSALDGRTS